MCLLLSADNGSSAVCKRPAFPASLFKTIVMKKLTFILALALCFEVQARGLAQSISLSERNAPLENIFKEIRKQSGYHFLYTDEMLQGTSPVSISVKNTSLETVLDKIFSEQPLQYTILERTIVIKPKKQGPSAGTSVATQLAPPTIKGVVRDAAGTPLAGATVTIKGTGTSTQTNSRGEFTIDAPDANAVLVITYVGYEALEIAAGN